MKVVRKFTFDSAHFIPGHTTCGNVHGHTYELEVELYGHVDEYGMATDFGEMKRKIQPLVDALDHKLLNDFIPIPTAENIILFLLPDITKAFPYVSRVRLHETKNCYAEWP